MKALIKYLPPHPDGYKGKTWENKSFVVTQDIKVGDEVYNDNDREPNKHLATKRCLYESCYKILGEVSPKATFVKDNKKYEAMPIYDKNSIYCEYKVKCPCCGDFK